MGFSVPLKVENHFPHDAKYSSCHPISKELKWSSFNKLQTSKRKITFFVRDYASVRGFQCKSQKQHHFHNPTHILYDLGMPLDFCTHMTHSCVTYLSGPHHAHEGELSRYSLCDTRNGKKSFGIKFILQTSWFSFPTELHLMNEFK